MPLADIGQYSRLLLQNQEKNQVEALKQLNEDKKLKIEALKIIPDIEKADIEQKKSMTEMLGLELDNKEKKQNLLQKATDMLSPSGEGELSKAKDKALEAKQGVQIATPEQIQKQMAGIQMPATLQVLKDQKEVWVGLNHYQL